MSLTRRWSEAGYMSQVVLTHALRQVSVSLIFDVRQKRTILMRRHRQTRRHERRSSGCRPLVGSPASCCLELANRSFGSGASPAKSGGRTRRRDPLPTKQGGAWATMVPCPVERLARMKDLRAVAPADHEPLGVNQAPNNAMERSRMLVTDRAFARSAPSIRLAHLER